MACSDKQIELATDAQLASEPNGNRIIYWMNRNFWGACQGAAAIEIFINILALRGPSPLVRIVAENSEDAISFDPLDAPPPGQTDPTYIDGGGWTSANRYYYQYTGQPQNYKRIVRLGIEISSSASPTLQQVLARLSASIRVRAVAAPQAISQTTTTLGFGVNNVFLDAFETAAFIKSRLTVKMSNPVAGAAVTVNVYSGNNASRTSLVGTATIAVGASDVSILVDGLGAYTQAQIVTPSGYSSGGTATVDSQLRAE